jgi:hypothetical protein
MSKQMTSTTSRFIRQFLLVELVASTIPDRLTSDVLAERAKVVPHIKGQRPLPLGSATSVGDSGARHRAPSGGRGEGRIGWGRLRVGVAIGFNGVVFIVGNKATVTKIMDPEPTMRCVKCDAEEPMRCSVRSDNGSGSVRAGTTHHAVECGVFYTGRETISRCSI